VFLCPENTKESLLSGKCTLSKTTHFTLLLLNSMELHQAKHLIPGNFIISCENEVPGVKANQKRLCLLPNSSRQEAILLEKEECAYISGVRVSFKASINSVLQEKLLQHFS